MTYSNDDFAIGSMAAVSLKTSNKMYNAVKHSDNAWYLPGDGYYGASVLVIHDRLIAINPSIPIPDEWVDVAEDAFYASCNAPSQEQNRHVDSDDFRAAIAALVAHIAAPPEPKPEEPTGDRATVRDRNGVLWTRHEENAGCWFDSLSRRWSPWSDLDVPADGVLWGGVE